MKTGGLLNVIKLKSEREFEEKIEGPTEYSRGLFL